MTHVLFLFLAGGLGTISRYGLYLLVGSHGFPYATTIINAVGCLVFGVALGLANGGVLSRENAPFVMVGFLGAFTTFSAFAAESEFLLRNARIAPFCIYVAVQNVVGILFVSLGLRLVRWAWNGYGLGPDVRRAGQLPVQLEQQPSRQ